MSNNILNFLLNKGIYSDVQLKINGKVYKLHKIILVESSDFFKSMFLNENQMDISHEIIIVDKNSVVMPSKIVDEIIKWCYHRNLNEIQLNDLIDYYYLYCCADFLLINTIKDYCCKMINKKITNHSIELKTIKFTSEENEIILSGGILIDKIIYKKIFLEHKMLFEYFKKHNHLFKEAGINTFIFNSFINSKETYEEMVDELVAFGPNAICLDYINKAIKVLKKRHIMQITLPDLKIYEAMQLEPLVDQNNYDKLIEMIKLDDLYENNNLINDHTKLLEQFCKKNNLTNLFKEKIRQALIIDYL